MKDEESYTAKQAKAAYLRSIKEMEAKLIDNKLGATVSSGKASYEFMLMMNDTRHMLRITKPLTEKEDFTNTSLEDNDLVIGDLT